MGGAAVHLAAAFPLPPPPALPLPPPAASAVRRVVLCRLVVVRPAADPLERAHWPWGSAQRRGVREPPGRKAGASNRECEGG